MEKKEKASGSHRPTAGKWNGAKVQTAGRFSQEKCFHHADHRVYFARAFPLLLADWDTLLTHKLENQTSVLLDIFVMEFCRPVTSRSVHSFPSSQNSKLCSSNRELTAGFFAQQNEPTVEP